MAKEGKYKGNEIDGFIRVYRKNFRRYKSIRKCKQPIVHLIRRTGKVEIREKETGNRFNFKHTSGEDRYILLDPTKKLYWEEQGKPCVGYILHEDYPVPLPANPVVATELLETVIEKVLNDERKYREREMKAKGKMWFYILIGIAIVIGVIYFGRSLLPPSAETQVVEVIRTNVSGVLM